MAQEERDGNSSSADSPIATSALGAAGVALVETEIQLYSSFQPARPTYDIGVDLRAISANGKRSVNLQVKASAAKNFNVQRRWANIPNFLIVYVWGLRLRGDAAVYVLAYHQAHRIVECCASKWLLTRSWLEAGGYSTTKPSAAILGAIEEYRATPERWRAALLAATE